MSQLVPLPAWAASIFGEHAPCARTLLRWVHGRKIEPAPVKIGRAYFVPPHARYTDRPVSLWERVNADRQKAEQRDVA
jgi:hypothetical protein